MKVDMLMRTKDQPILVDVQVRESSHRPGRLKVSFVVLDAEGAPLIAKRNSKPSTVPLPLNDRGMADFRLEMN
jgi:hypothetical protein